VTLTRDFYIGQHEVTNQEYMEALQWAYDRGCVTATTSTVRDNLDGSTEELLPDGYDPSNRPVQKITWFGAARYCDWLSTQMDPPLAQAYEHTGDWSCNGGDPYGAQGYRLPTDAEWEYAAQSDDERIYPWGNQAPSCSRANYNVFGSWCVYWTSSVGNYPDGPAALGLLDMAGNVFEWCNDWPGGQAQRERSL
jgi:formylglycine-generating enzyme required for sulfatase activity